MACCAALTLLFAWVYRLVGWALPGRDDEFAPAATWPPTPVDRVAEAVPTDRLQVQQRWIGQACIVVGIAWFGAGMLAMHAFGVLDIRSVPLDLAFHSSGLWLATIGAALRFEPVRLVGRAA